MGAPLAVHAESGSADSAGQPFLSQPAPQAASAHWDRLKQAWEQDARPEPSPYYSAPQAPQAALSATHGQAVGFPANPVSLHAVQDTYQDPLQQGPQVPAVERPSDLKKISEINPFYSYEPDPVLRASDPAHNLCPEMGVDETNGENGLARQCPPINPLSDAPFYPRAFPNVGYCWLASNFHHNPLYFENAPLERYGHSHHPLVEPFASAGLFTAQLVGLPYQMTIDPPHECVYTLGWYRPGECAPQLHYQVPLNAKAAAVEAGVLTGLFYLIP